MTETCLHTAATITGQHADLYAVWRLGAHTIRLQIRSDFYEFQSHARADRWDGTRWQPMHSIAPGGMRTPRALCARPGELPEAFDDDVAALLDTVRMILSVTSCTDSPTCARSGCADCQRSYGPRT